MGLSAPNLSAEGIYLFSQFICCLSPSRRKTKRHAPVNTIRVLISNAIILPREYPSENVNLLLAKSSSKSQKPFKGSL